MNPDREARIAEVLATHPSWSSLALPGRNRVWRCSCGKEGVIQDHELAGDVHRAHQAAEFVRLLDNAPRNPDSTLVDWFHREFNTASGICVHPKNSRAQCEVWAHHFAATAPITIPTSHLRALVERWRGFVDADPTTYARPLLRELAALLDGGS